MSHDQRQIPDRDSPRDVLIAGVQVVALLFALGMGCILYFLWTENTVWAIVWWLFTAVTVPSAAAYFYSEARFHYLGVRDIEPTAYHRLAALFTLLAFGGLFALVMLG